MVRHIGIVRQFCAISEATYIFLQYNELGRVVSAFIQVYLFIAYIIINYKDKLPYHASCIWSL